MMQPCLMPELWIAFKMLHGLPTPTSLRMILQSIVTDVKIVVLWCMWFWLLMAMVYVSSCLLLTWLLLQAIARYWWQIVILGVCYVIGELYILCVSVLNMQTPHCRHWVQKKHPLAFSSTSPWKMFGFVQNSQEMFMFKTSIPSTSKLNIRCYWWRNSDVIFIPCYAFV